MNELFLQLRLLKSASLHLTVATHVPNRTFRIFRALIRVYEQHKRRRSADFEDLKYRNVRSGCSTV